MLITRRSQNQPFSPGLLGNNLGMDTGQTNSLARDHLMVLSPGTNNLLNAAKLGIVNHSETSEGSMSSAAMGTSYNGSSYNPMQLIMKPYDDHHHVDNYQNVEKALP